VLTALWGTLFQLAISPFSWMDAAMEGVGQMMETEADREPEEEKARRRTLSMEDLRRKHSWWGWPSGESREGQPGSLIDVEAAERIVLQNVELLNVELQNAKKTKRRITKCRKQKVESYKRSNQKTSNYKMSKVTKGGKTKGQK
jgi:hypothetical protein